MAKKPVKIATKKKAAKPVRPTTTRTKTKTQVVKAKPRRVVAKASTPSLGRPKVTGEEQLYLLFKEDYHARQVFDFLRVQTVKDLEQFSSQQIVKLLSRPITETVDRIRRKLAEKNRSLLDDTEFALAHRRAAEPSAPSNV